MWRLRRFRPLLVIFVLAALAGLTESAARRFSREGGQAGPPGTPPLLPAASEAKLVEVVGDLYPARKDPQYMRGFQALRKLDVPAARRHFEQALAADPKDEPLLYYYALTLVLAGEESSTIESAIAVWRRNFPRANRPDPRLIREHPRRPAPVRRYSP